MKRMFEQKWAETFRYAAKHSPYYRELFAVGRVAPRAPRLAAAVAPERRYGAPRRRKDCEPCLVPPLEQLPTVDKTILSARNLDFLCVPQERVVEIVTTSGTTGDNLTWMLTDDDLRRLAENERLSFECAGLTSRDTVLVAVAMDRCFIAGLAYWLGLRELGCAIARVGSTSPILVLEMIERLRPSAIVAVPSFLRLIGDKARETGFDLAGASVKKAICIGEPVRDRDWTLNSSGRAISEAWHAKVFCTYGVTELSNSLCECEAGVGAHVHTEQLHLDVLDDEGRPLPDGEVGEVVATTFGVQAMPLIRYRTGDCAALFREKCQCGRTEPRLGPIIGRKSQRLKFKGVSIFPSTLATVLEQTAGVNSYVIVARKESELSDSMEVLFHGPASPSVLREALQARAKTAPVIRHASPEEIESLQMPPQARKRRTFVDLR